MALVPVSIRERIIRQIELLYGSLYGTVRRNDPRGLRLLDREALIVAGADSASDLIDGRGGTGGGVTDKTMSLVVGVMRWIPETINDEPETLFNRDLDAIERTLMVSPFIIEQDTEARLAIDTRVVASESMDVGEEQPEIFSAVQFEIHYRHDRENPASLTGDITQVNEDDGT